MSHPNSSLPSASLRRNLRARINNICRSPIVGLLLLIALVTVLFLTVWVAPRNFGTDAVVAPATSNNFSAQPQRVAARVLNPHYLAAHAQNESVLLLGSDGAIDLIALHKNAVTIESQAIRGAIAAHFAVAHNPGDASWVAVGELGQILARPDGSDRWHLVESPVSDSMRRLAVDQINNQWFAVTDSKYLVSGAASAQAWRQLQAGAGVVADVVWLPQQQSVVATGAGGWLAKSLNGGADWQTLAVPTPENFTKIYVSGDNIFLLTDTAEIWSTDGRFSDWRKWPDLLEGQITDLDFDAKTQRLTLVTAAGEILSADSTAKQFTRELYTQDYLARIARVSTVASTAATTDSAQGSLLAIGNTGQLWMTQPETQNWEKIHTDIRVNFNTLSHWRDGFIVAGEGGAVVYVNGVTRKAEVIKMPIAAFIHGLGYAEHKPQTLIGARGLLLESVDGWHSWTAPNAELDSGDYLFSLINLSDGSQLVAGPPGTILQRAAGTDDWKIVLAVNDVNRAYFHRLVATPEGSVIAIAGPGHNYFSDDFGQSWRELKSDEVRHRYAAIYSEAWSRFIAVGQQGLVSYSQDGVRWHSVLGVSDENFQALTQVPLSTKANALTRLLMATQSGKIFWSDTGGALWQQATGDTVPSVLHLKALNGGRVLLASGLAGALLRSQDRGLSWQRIALPIKGNLREPVEDVPRGIVYIPSRAGEVIVSRDYGQHWELLEPLTSTSIKGVVIDVANDQILTYGERLTQRPRLN